MIRTGLRIAVAAAALGTVGVPAFGDGITTVVAGFDHTCALTTGGGVLCWGTNFHAQIGDGTTAFKRVTPTPVSGLRAGVETLAVGGDHTCALTAGRAVLCWGYNFYGQLGDGTTTDRVTPTPVGGLESGVRAIGAGMVHTCAVTAGGGVMCWGWNAYGQLGDGTTTNQPTPTAVVGLGSEVAAIAAGRAHTCALTTAGGVLYWGDNDYGQVGDGTILRRQAPKPVSGLDSGVTGLAAHNDHTCAVKADGGVVCWGHNSFGRLGDGTTTDRRTPTPVSGLPGPVSSVTAGWYHTCAVTTAGSVLCWGRNFFGGLGSGTTIDSIYPAVVSGLTNARPTIAAGYGHTCVLTTGAGMQCWGRNANGALGDGTATDRLTPALVLWLDVKAITPTGGSVAGGLAVTITGAAFQPGLTVMFGGTLATGVSLVNSTTITALTPAHAAGVVDLVVRSPGGQEATLAGSFTYGAPPGGDFSGDAKTDILWRHATQGDVWLWPMDGVARTAESYVRTVSDTNWGIRGLADFTGDVKADVLWRHQTTGQIYLWPMNGSAPQAETYVATVDPAYDIAGIGDFDGDGKADIVWRHQTLGEVWVWRMDGATPLNQVYLGTVDPAYVVVGVSDVDGDGKADIVWRHATAGEVWIWRMNGTTRLAETWVGTVADVGYEIVGLADFTGDRKADILWRHATLGEVWLWPMDGTTKQAETWVGTVPDTNYRIVNTGDYDGDGKADILWHHATLGEVWVWRMDGATRLSQTWVGSVADVGYRIIKGK
jgi:alpha-tubulin suppressor-like RCC1 family protein